MDVRTSINVYRADFDSLTRYDIPFGRNVGITLIDPTLKLKKGIL